MTIVCPDCGNTTDQAFSRNLNLVDYYVCGQCGQAYGIHEDNNPALGVNKFALQITPADKYALALKVSQIVNAHGVPFAEGRAPLEDEEEAYQLDLTGTWWLKFYPDHGPMLVSRWGLQGSLIPVLKGLCRWTHNNYVDDRPARARRRIAVPFSVMQVADRPGVTPRLQREHRTRLVSGLFGAGGRVTPVSPESGELDRFQAGVCQVAHEDSRCVIVTPEVSATLSDHILRGAIWTLRGRPQMNTGFEHVWRKDK